ncbi:MAG: hypothetical protein IE884_01870 [Sulfuricurvum sp.]|nr:hypothetical protein [Sulfuricurvum sp.]
MIKKVLGVFTISPDDIAILASGETNAPLELTSLFAHEGKKVVYLKGEMKRAKPYRILCGHCKAVPQKATV